MSFFGHDDTQAAMLDNPGVANWWANKQSGVSRDPITDSNVHRFLPARGKNSDGAIHGYRPEIGAGLGKPIRDTSWRAQQTWDAIGGDGQSNTLLLPSMSGQTKLPAAVQRHMESPNFTGSKGSSLADSGRTRSVAAPDSAHFEAWMAAQRAPSQLEMKNNRQSFDERMHMEGLQAEPSGLISKLSAQRNPRHTDAGLMDGQRMVREKHADLAPITSSDYRGAVVNDDGKSGGWGGGHAHVPTQRTPGIGRTDILHQYETRHAGGSVGGTQFSNYGAANTSFAPDRHIPGTTTTYGYAEPTSMHEPIQPSESPPWARGRSDIGIDPYTMSPRLQRAEYAAHERQARESIQQDAYRRVHVNGAGIDEKAKAASVALDPYSSAALASSDLNPQMAAREWRLAQDPQASFGRTARGISNLVCP